MEQRAALPAVAQLLGPGEVLLLTIGPTEGEVTGKVCGDDVYHASLSPDEYESILKDCEFNKVSIDAESKDARMRTVLLAHKGH